LCNCKKNLQQNQWLIGECETNVEVKRSIKSITYSLKTTPTQ
jgi:hypothetical protein